LPVPWLSQLGINAAFAPGDCGAADVAMVLNYQGKAVTVDQVSRATGKPGGFLTLSALDLQNAAAVFGLSLIHGTNALTTTIVSEIAAKRPVMALVNYAALPNELKHDPAYTRGHWILIVGFDGVNVVFHDSYELTMLSGAFKVMTLAEFDHAWSMTNADFSIPRQALRIGQIVPPPPPVSAALRGLQMRADGGSGPLDFQCITDGKLNSAKIMSNTSFEEFDQLCTMVSGKNIVFRMFAAPDNPALGNAAMFFDQHKLWLGHFAAKGGIYVEIHNEPNLPQEGFGQWWTNADGFGAFYSSVAELIHMNFPTLKCGYPGLSPNTANEPDFIASLKRLILVGKVDWIGAHSYWIDRLDMNIENNGRHYRRFLGLGKPVIITEFANVTTQSTDFEKGQQYAAYYTSLEVGVIGAYAFVSSASDPAFNTSRQTWVRNGAITDIVRGVA
jgi:hypothetical protein